MSFDEIKKVFIENQSKIETLDFESTSEKILNSPVSIWSDGNKYKLIKKYIKDKKVLYFTEDFICCEEGIILYERDFKVKFFSKGFYEFDKNIFIWLPLIEKNYPLLQYEIDKIVNKEKYKNEEIEEIDRLENLNSLKTNLFKELDKDGNGEVDVIEGNDFNLLFKKHQNLIKEIDKKHIQEFVKVSSYLKTKKNNIQLIFKSIKDTPNEETLNQYVEILKDDIHSYNLVLFNSLNMIVSLVEDDTITFYEIHEMFDNLNIFDSKHERDVSQKLNNIGDGLKELMYSIEEMGSNIERQMGELSYVTEQSNQQLENQLQSIDSSIKTNNLLTGINSYQTYKLRKGE
tara:strand:- start:2720 stop:3754 length:1035 start_codon:yes stop_codon:yes gene_type:complete